MGNTGEYSHNCRKACLLLNEKHLHNSKWIHMKVFPHPSAHPGTCDHHLPEFWFCSSLSHQAFSNFVCFILYFSYFLFPFLWMCNISKPYFKISEQRPKLFGKNSCYTLSINEFIESGIRLRYLIFLGITLILAFFLANNLIIVLIIN